jgi:DNA-binding GntR family transcriptional regulator
MNLLAPQPRYRQLAQTLISEIESGRYPVGDLLPTEFELCEQFGASRFTVREAIKQLVGLGLVDRQAGVGTRVKTAQPSSEYRQVMQRLADLQQYSAQTELEIFHAQTVEADRQLAQLLRGSPGQLWLRAEGVRRVGDRKPPICFTELYIHPAFRSLQGLVGRRLRVSVYTLIEQQFGEQVAEVQQQMRAVALSPAMARVLKARAKSPALWISRHYLNRRGEAIEVAISTHPAERFTYSENFVRDWNGRHAPTGAGGAL